jgi:GrpB-like predicted nucleotidyltransferase (UPF0157 family)
VVVVRITVVAYDPAWPEQFAAVKDDLTRALEGIDHAIEHVGSTSVPGLAAKPVLDIDVVVEAGDVDAAIAALERSGYEPLGDLGVPERYALRAPDENPRRNVYVVVAGSQSLRNHLAVREVLRTTADLREAYGAWKLELSRRDLPDIDAYVAAKSPIVQRILSAAGFTEGELAEFAAINKAATAAQAPDRPTAGE